MVTNTNQGAQCEGRQWTGPFQKDLGHRADTVNMLSVYCTPSTMSVFVTGAMYCLKHVDTTNTNTSFPYQNNTFLILYFQQYKNVSLQNPFFSFKTEKAQMLDVVSSTNRNSCSITLLRTTYSVKLAKLGFIISINKTEYECE